MPPPDILHFLNTSDFMRRWVEVHPGMNRTRLLRWMGEQVGLSREQMWALIYGDGARIQADAVAQFARMFELDDERREYLRRLVYQESCDRQHLSEARLAVWEMHAAATGVPLDAIPALMEEEAVVGAGEALALALIPLLRETAGAHRTVELATRVRGGPSPAAVTAALDAEASGIRLGELSFRAVALPAPASANDWRSLCWHGLYGLARESLLSPPQGVRATWLLVGSADTAAMAEIERAEARLFKEVRRVLIQTAAQPVTRITALLSSALVLTPLSDDFDSPPHPAAVGETPRLPESEVAISQGEGEASSEPLLRARPCIYHHLSFLPFVRSVVSWRESQGLKASISWFAAELGVPRSTAHGLVSGRSPLLPRHVSDMAAALELDEDAAAYLEGVVRFQQATDLQDKARERLALIAFAAKKGVRTWEGESFRVAAHWAPWAILALADLEDFRPNPGWITRMLGGRLLPDDARSLVRALVDTGFLVPQDRGPPRPATPERRYCTEDDFDLRQCALFDSALRLLCTELRIPHRGRRMRGRLLALSDEALTRIVRAQREHSERVMAAARASDARASAGLSRLDRVVLLTTHHMPVISENLLRR